MPSLTFLNCGARSWAKARLAKNKLQNSIEQRSLVFIKFSLSSGSLTGHDFVRRVDVAWKAILAGPFFVLWHLEFLLDFVKRLSRLDHFADALHQQRVIFLRVVEDFYRAGLAVPGND